MPVTDPRDRRDVLLETESRERVPPDEFRFVNEDTGETAGWTLVVFEALADTPEIDRDPSVDDEEITDIRWFDGLPGNVFNPDLLEPAYERCAGSQ